MAEGYQNKYLNDNAYAINNAVAYSTNAEMLSAISDYLGSGKAFVRFFVVRCSEAPLGGSAASFVYIGDNTYGGGIGIFNGSNATLFKIGFANGVGSISIIN